MLCSLLKVGIKLFQSFKSWYHSSILVIQMEELFHLGEESCCCFINFIYLFIFIHLPKVWVWPFSVLLLRRFLFPTCLGKKNTTCNPGDVFCYLQGTGKCVSLCFSESTLSVLKGGLPSYFIACCRVGVNAYMVLMSFSWKSNFLISVWNILLYGAESSNCNSISSVPILKPSFLIPRILVAFCLLLWTP